MNFLCTGEELPRSTFSHGGHIELDSIIMRQATELLLVSAREQIAKNLLPYQPYPISVIIGCSLQCCLPRNGELLLRMTDILTNIRIGNNERLSAARLLIVLQVELEVAA